MSAAPRAVPPSVNGWNAEYLDDQRARYRDDPSSVSPEMRAFFQGFDLASAAMGSPAGGQPGNAQVFQAQVGDLIEAYRSFGHVAAKLDPFGSEPERPPALEPSFYGLTDEDMDREVAAGGVGLDGSVTLRELIAHLENRYCSTIGVEIMHISDREEREWLLDRFERGVDRSEPTRGEKVHTLEQLIKAEQFERFLGKRYPGDKRFSLEGSESLIPLLDRMLEDAADLGVEEVVLGMAHRGRLNVLNNVLGKSYEQIFTEFEDAWDEDFADGGGDVKYHRGYSGTREFRSGSTLHLAMASNPSHLEAVNGVVLGRTRAKQSLKGDADRKRVMAMLIHGDAAIAGQGVVAETLNLAALEGYATGGTIHVVVNNLIGFTTKPEDGRSTRYCTDIAKAFEAPVLHVNGEDPQAVIACAHFAAGYRQKFGKDIFVDMYCYRRYGHNEQDEPSFTQPILAAKIKNKPSVLSQYADRLKTDGTITPEDHKLILTRLEDALDRAQQMAKESPSDPTIDPGSERWDGLTHEFRFGSPGTAVSEDLLREVCSALGRVPDGFKVNRKLKKLLEQRANLLETGDISYADAESLAYGTLLCEGYPVRVSGQDSRRGTFSHRHAVLRDSESGEPYIPLNGIRSTTIPHNELTPVPNADASAQAGFTIFDSPLSEYGVLGFEYGYSLAEPNHLVIWEAQFGDFVNGAQVVIDQFIASAELKWQRWSGLVLLLPHGYEGAGPEHSSARLERFLKLCGDSNLQVCYPTTAAQTFHMLRRQVTRSFRKPLVVMSPKSMLRVPTSHISELTTGGFEEILDDPHVESASKVERVVLCTGKLYHELHERRVARSDTKTAIVRIEQIYPFHAERMREILSKYGNRSELVFAQEEPRNSGAFLFVSDRLRTSCDVDTIRYVGRPESASPATGSKKRDRAEQERILTDAIGPKPTEPSKPNSKTPVTAA